VENYSVERVRVAGAQYALAHSFSRRFGYNTCEQCGLAAAAAALYNVQVKGRKLIKKRIKSLGRICAQKE
jgi:hypothetical protein